MNGFMDFIQNHFGHAAPILISGAFATAIIAERTRALFLAYPIRDMAGFFNRIRDLVLTDQVPQAVALCDQMGHKPVAKVVKAALLRAHHPETLIEHGLQISVGEESQAIQKRTSFLATIANVATLLGLFGTIAGLIHSFEAVGHADPQQKAALLAAGISTAMNATMLGLGVAIPCMIAFSFLMNRASRLTAELEHGAVRVLDLLKQRFYLEETEGVSAGDSAESKPRAAARRAA